MMYATAPVRRFSRRSAFAFAAALLAHALPGGSARL